jgi:hypothetical protein
MTKILLEAALIRQYTITLMTTGKKNMMMNKKRIRKLVVERLSLKLAPKFKMKSLNNLDLLTKSTVRPLVKMSGIQSPKFTTS